MNGEYSDSETLDTTCESIAKCQKCGNAIRPGDIFCSVCGNRLDGYSFEKRISKGQISFARILIYYFLSIVVFCVFRFSGMEYNFKNLIAVDIIFSVLTLVFAFTAINNLIPLYSFKRVKLWMFPLLLFMAVLYACIVFYIAEYFNIYFFKTIYRETHLFLGTKHPMLYAILFIGIQPALFEEMAYRGFIFNDLLRFTSSTAVIIITTILFGIIHFSTISLVWILPLGYAFGYLRNKYNVLWYSMFFHFVYNLTIVCIEFYIE